MNEIVTDMNRCCCLSNVLSEKEVLRGNDINVQRKQEGRKRAALLNTTVGVDARLLVSVL
jgi:hypothetical protein